MIYRHFVKKHQSIAIFRLFSRIFADFSGISPQMGTTPLALSEQSRRRLYTVALMLSPKTARANPMLRIAFPSHRLTQTHAQPVRGVWRCGCCGASGSRTAVCLSWLCAGCVTASYLDGGVVHGMGLRNLYLPKHHGWC